jgi:hypothetical protein
MKILVAIFYSNFITKFHQWRHQSENQATLRRWNGNNEIFFFSKQSLFRVLL